MRASIKIPYEMDINKIQCRNVSARKMCAYSEASPKQFYLSENKKPRSVHGHSWHSKEPKKDSFWSDLGDRTYSLKGNQSKPQRLIFTGTTPTEPHVLHFVFELISVSSGHISPLILPEIKTDNFNGDGKLEYFSPLISSARAVGFEASKDFSGVIKIYDIYPICEGQD